MRREVGVASYLSKEETLALLLRVAVGVAVGVVSFDNLAESTSS